MKKTGILQLLGLLLSLAMVFSLAGCGKTGTQADPTGGKDSVFQSSDHKDGDGPSEGTETPSSGNGGTDRTSGSGAAGSDSDSPTDSSSDGGSGSSSSNSSGSPTGSANSNTNTNSNTNSNGSTQSSSGYGTTNHTGTNSEPIDTPVQNPTPTPTVNTDISPIQPKNYYGRTWLSNQPGGGALVQDYDALARGIEGMEQTIQLPVKVTQQQFALIFSCYRGDYPQHFWLGSSYTMTTLSDKVIAVTPTYSIPSSAKAAEQKKFEDAAKSLLSGINQTMTQYEIEKTIHDRLILSCRYSDGANAHNAYGALVGKVAVCEGYARAFEYLCRCVGIQALFVHGSSVNPKTGAPEGHAWTIVQIDGQYYHTDPTWDDAGEPNEENIHYAWFDVTTSQISKDHVLEQDGYAYPNCTATAANYFKKNNGELASLSVDGVVRAAKKQGSSYVFHGYILDGKDPAPWFNQNAEALASRFGLNGYSYYLDMTGPEVIFTMSPYGG